MRSKAIFVLAVVVLTPFFTQTVLADFPTFPVCTVTGEQYAPDISGDIVVWRDNRDGGDDIYGYDLSTSQEFEVCTESGIQGVADIYEDLIIWADLRNGNGDIYGFNLSTSTESPICTTLAVQANPSVNEDIVVWRDSRNGNHNPDIYGSTIPEPATLLLLGLGAVMLRRKRRSQP